MLLWSLLPSLLPEDTPMKSRLNALRFGPRGLLITALLMAGLLVLMSFSAWRSTLRGAELMLIGQTEQLLENMRLEVGSPSAANAHQRLEKFLEKNREKGLRYVGIYTIDGKKINTVGHPLLDPSHI